ncbi:isocitrate lyase/phosphoenolpyruvate mutase family protein [Streptomyces sp. NPDC050743]|uniref:isocitrate lyase/phosphoenolpyruvate mutase family protein n=1 Tax=Streptomyces sp. NPDC050743 TaxID=3365634 RepID=UPI0037AAFA4F
MNTLDFADGADLARHRAQAHDDPDFVIVARTDARAVEGFDAALRRARRYREAGADMLFLEALRSDAEIEAAAAAFPDTPLLFNWAEGGKTPPTGHDLSPCQADVLMAGGAIAWMRRRRRSGGR